MRTASERRRSRSTTRPRRPRRFLPEAAGLEERSLLSITIQIDYSHDTNNFFNTQAKRDLMQEAANILGSDLNDQLTAIAPSGGNTWQANFPDPGTGAPDSITNLYVPANTIIVYVGGRPLPGVGEAGDGATGGFTVSGDQNWLNTVSARGQAGALAATPTDYGPWGGSIAFDNAATNWFFGTTTAGLGPTQTDFLSVAEHELGHVLGIGTSPSWQTYATLNGFVGPASEAVYGGPVPLAPGLDHWKDGTQSDGHNATMDPFLTNGTRELFTTLDYAGLTDVGWQVQPPFLSLSAAAVSVPDNSPNVTVTVTRSGGLRPLSVVYATYDGTAKAGADYSITFGALNFGLGQTSQTITIPLLNDPTPDGNETFFVGLSSPTAGGVLWPNPSEAVTLTDVSGIAPPAAPALSASSDTGVSHGDGVTQDNGSAQAPLTFTVTGVNPANGVVRLFDVTGGAQVPLAGPVQAAGGVATVTLSGQALPDGVHLIAATTASTATGPQSADSPATPVTIQTSLQVVGTSPDVPYMAAALPNGQVVVTFSHPIAGLVPDVANGGGVAALPYAVTMAPLGPEGGLFTAFNGINSGVLPVNGTQVYHVNANGTSQITFTPSVPLGTNLYMIRIDGGLTDLAGNPLQGGAVYKEILLFPDRPATPDFSPLLATSVTTRNGAVTINSSPAPIPQPDTIAITFNRQLDPLTVNAGTVHLVAMTATGLMYLPVGVTYGPTTRSIYLTPESALFPGVNYVIGVDGGAQGVTDDQGFPGPGVPLAATFYDGFQVNSWPAAPGQGPFTVTATSPAGPTAGQPFGYAAVSFSEALNVGSLHPYSVTLGVQSGGLNNQAFDYADQPLNARLAFNPNVNELIIVPTVPLGNDVYLLALGNMTSYDGNPLLNDAGQPAGVNSLPVYRSFTLAAPGLASARAASQLGQSAADFVVNPQPAPTPAVASTQPPAAKPAGPRALGPGDVTARWFRRRVPQSNGRGGI